MRQAGFPRQARVLARADFDRAFREGRRIASPLYSLHRVADDGPARIGLAVSRKVDPHAVGRNRIKRVLRDCFRHLRTQLPGGLYVVVARRAAAAQDNATLRDDFAQLLQRAGCLPVSDADGTMAHLSHVDPPPTVAPDHSGG